MRGDLGWLRFDIGIIYLFRVVFELIYVIERYSIDLKIYINKMVFYRVKRKYRGWFCG